MVNLIWWVGLPVVLVAGEIDISCVVAASVAQNVAAKTFAAIGGGDWFLGFLVAGALRVGLGVINATLSRALSRRQ